MNTIENNKSSDKLQAKDFITIGIFSALNFVVMMISALANVTPYTYLFYAAVYSFLNAIVYLVLTSKVPKKGTIILFNIITIIYLMVTGVFGMINAAFILVSCIIAEIIVGNRRKSLKRLSIAYVVFCVGVTIAGEFLMFGFPDNYVQQMAGAGVDPGYVEVIANIAANTMWFVLSIAASAVLSIAGLLLGKNLIKKHLAKAGIV